MKILNKETSNVPNEYESIIEKQQARIEYLESWLVSVLVRNELKRADEIAAILKQLDLVEPAMLSYFVLDNYGRNYFSKECDVQFKQELAAAILTRVRLYNTNYKNEVLEGLEAGTSQYSQNYIYAENI